MPQKDWQASEKIYGYVPEEPITYKEYNNYMYIIKQPVVHEGYSDDALQCDSGACPIEADINTVSL